MSDPRPVLTGLAAGSTRRAVVARRFLRSRTGPAGLAGLLGLLLLAAAGPALAPDRGVDPGAFLAPPGAGHWLGTTQAGRDVLALTVAGLRTSLLVGLGAAVLQTAIAAAVGTLAAFHGGWVDRVATWVIDLLLVVPAFFLIAVLTVPRAGRPGSALLLVVLLAGLGWMLSARVVRAMALSVTALDYVTAARYMSVPAGRILTRHVLPNISSLLIVDATLALAAAVLAETSLSFLGFGLQPPHTSLGALIAEGQGLAATHPWVFLAPAAALTAMLVAVTFVGDGLRDALDPGS